MSTDDRKARTALLRKGLIPALTRAHDYEGATAQYIALISAYPEDAALNNEAALYALRNDRKQQYIGFLQTTTKASPRDSRFFIDLAQAQNVFADLPAAIDGYAHAIAIRKDRADLYTAKAALEETTATFRRRSRRLPTPLSTHLQRPAVDGLHRSRPRPPGSRRRRSGRTQNRLPHRPQTSPPRLLPHRHSTRAMELPRPGRHFRRSRPHRRRRPLPLRRSLAARPRRPLHLRPHPHPPAPRRARARRPPRRAHRRHRLAVFAGNHRRAGAIARRRRRHRQQLAQSTSLRSKTASQRSLHPCPRRHRRCCRHLLYPRRARRLRHNGRPATHRRRSRSIRRHLDLRRPRRWTRRKRRRLAQGNPVDTRQQQPRSVRALHPAPAQPHGLHRTRPDP